MIALGRLPRGLAGLAERSPARAAAFAACYLSLAGVPPLAGFFGEFAVIAELARVGLYWVILLGVFASALLAFGALRDLRLVFLTSPGELVPPPPPNRLALAGTILAAVLVAVYGVFALPISTLALQSAAAAGLR
jgi:NADH-quinone oxidoreductase subunit N